MAKETITVPDIGGAENVDVIEVCVAVGDVIAVDDPLIVLESDKASMDVPAPKAGKVVSVLIKEGDQVSQGAAVIELETEADAKSASPSPASPAPASSPAPAPKPAPAASAAAKQTIAVPDIGGAENVDVIEISVKVGAEVAEGDTLIVLESDKASMDVPSPAAGKVVSIALKEGDKVSKGSPILELATAAATAPEPAPAAPQSTVAAGASSVVPMLVPDIGGAENVDVIEVAIKVGQTIAEGDTLIVLESDKASMEIPAPQAGVVKSVSLKEGDKVSRGSAIGELEVVGAAPAKPAPSAAAPQPAAPEASAPPSPGGYRAATAPAPTPHTADTEAPAAGADVYAGPAVRKLARQLGIDLTQVKASGPRGRIAKDDVKAYVKSVMRTAGKGTAGATGGAGIPAIPAVDFAQFGEIEMKPMSKIKKLTAANMSRNWLNVPHVTQFDDVDITELEAFRKAMKAEADAAGVKLTPLPFLIKAAAAALRAEPSFNVSMHADGEHIVQKNYVHIGLAVDTPHGLMVPVIRDADKKGLYQLAEEVTTLAKKARDGKLLPKEMQGGCFTISSLGAVGGTGFTPIVNAPEVAILGVSRAEMRPVWDGNSFMPRLMLPLSLSYDHRAINGSDAGRFFTYLNTVMADIRKLLL